MRESTNFTHNAPLTVKHCQTGYFQSKGKLCYFHFILMNWMFPGFVVIKGRRVRSDDITGSLSRSQLLHTQQMINDRHIWICSSEVHVLIKTDGFMRSKTPKGFQKLHLCLHHVVENKSKSWGLWRPSGEEQEHKQPFITGFDLMNLQWSPTLNPEGRSSISQSRGVETALKTTSE